MLAATISRVLEKIADRRPLWDRGRIWTRGVGRGGIGVSSSRPTTMRSSSRSVARSSAASGIGPVRVLNLRALRRSGFQRPAGAHGSAYRNAAEKKGRYDGPGRTLELVAGEHWCVVEPGFFLSLH